MMKTLNKFDAFPKFHKDFVQRTHLGACLSILTFVLISVFLFTELSNFLQPQKTNHLDVDSSLNKILSIHLDIDFQYLPCSLLSLSAMDASNKHYIELQDDNIIKKDLPRGNTLSKRNSDFAQIGCNISGFVEVDKVAGQLYFGPPKDFEHMEVLLLRDFNLSHKINVFHFGRVPEKSQIKMSTPPLHGVTRMQKEKLAGKHQYFIKIVSTEYENTSADVIHLNQYSVTEHFKTFPEGETSGNQVAGLFFVLDVSSVMLRVIEKNHSFGHFLTIMCAIIGGTFTVVGIIDGLFEQLFKVSRTIPL
eukprot:GSMAST32.ASY1.ANO1.1965.1 assembled CDS